MLQGSTVGDFLAVAEAVGGKISATVAVAKAEGHRFENVEKLSIVDFKKSRFFKVRQTSSDLHFFPLKTDECQYLLV